MAQEGFKRKLAAIFSADAASYSRLMGEDEEDTVRTLTAYREVMTTLIRQHHSKQRPANWRNNCRSEHQYFHWGISDCPR